LKRCCWKNSSGIENWICISVGALSAALTQDNKRVAKCLYSSLETSSRLEIDLFFGEKWLDCVSERKFSYYSISDLIFHFFRIYRCKYVKKWCYWLKWRFSFLRHWSSLRQIQSSDEKFIISFFNFPVSSSIQTPKMATSSLSR
jgi:hypothetical protein